MMRLIYLLIVLYLAAQMVSLLFWERKFLKQAGIAIVLLVFLLRLFLIE